MTPEKFLSRHAQEWGTIKDDLLALVDAQSIAHQADQLPMAITAEGRATLNGVFADRVAGFASCRRILCNLTSSEPPPPATEATFEPAKIDESPFPAMPAPKNRTKKK